MKNQKNNNATINANDYIINDNQQVITQEYATTLVNDLLSIAKCPRKRLAKNVHSVYYNAIEQTRLAYIAYHKAVENKQTDKATLDNLKSNIYNALTIVQSYLGKVNGYSVISPKATDSNDTILYLNGYACLDKIKLATIDEKLASLINDRKQARANAKQAKASKDFDKMIEFEQQEQDLQKQIIDLKKQDNTQQEQFYYTNANTFAKRFIKYIVKLVAKQATQSPIEIAKQRKQRNASKKQAKAQAKASNAKQQPKAKQAKKMASEKVA